MLRLSESGKKDLVNTILYHIDKSDDIECTNGVVTIRHEYDKHHVFEIENFRDHAGESEKYIITCLIDNVVKDSITVHARESSEEFTKSARYIVDMCSE